jgi:hypothetical protein
MAVPGYRYGMFFWCKNMLPDRIQSRIQLRIQRPNGIWIQSEPGSETLENRLSLVKSVKSILFENQPEEDKICLNRTLNIITQFHAGNEISLHCSNWMPQRKSPGPFSYHISNLHTKLYSFACTKNLFMPTFDEKKVGTDGVLKFTRRKDGRLNCLTFADFLPTGLFQIYCKFFADFTHNLRGFYHI